MWRFRRLANVAVAHDPKPRRTVVQSAIRIGLTVLAIGSSGALFVHNFISWGPQEGPSMFPTLPISSSEAIFSRRHRMGKDVKIGDVVIFENPIFLRERACKRIIGMPGDYVLLDPSQSPTVGGAPVSNIYEGKHRQEPAMVQVPEGHVWVAGDNLSYSRDSRFYGPVPMALITGKLLYSGQGWFTWNSFRKPQFQPARDLYQNLPKPVERDSSHENPETG